VLERQVVLLVSGLDRRPFEIGVVSLTDDSISGMALGEIAPRCHNARSRMLF